MQGLIHLYYGDGKGKTTTAVGLAVRGAGNGIPVAFVQFMKGNASGEIRVLEQLNQVQIFKGEKDFGFFRFMPQKEQEELTAVHQRILKEGIAFVCENGGIIVLDELTHALNFGLVDEGEVRELLENKPENVEVVITGRNPMEWLIQKASYVSEIKKIKHPFDDGVAARAGIEL